MPRGAFGILLVDNFPEVNIVTMRLPKRCECNHSSLCLRYWIAGTVESLKRRAAFAVINKPPHGLSTSILRFDDAQPSDILHRLRGCHRRAPRHNVRLNVGLPIIPDAVKVQLAAGRHVVYRRESWRWVNRWRFWSRITPFVIGYNVFNFYTWIIIFIECVDVFFVPVERREPPNIYMTIIQIANTSIVCTESYRLQFWVNSTRNINKLFFCCRLW